MKIIVRPRQCGKTTDLIEFARQKEALIICQDYTSAREMWDIICKNKLHHNDGSEMWKPISWSSLPDSVCSLAPKTIVVDNAEIVLERMLHKFGVYPLSNLVGVTMSGVVEHNYNELIDYNEWKNIHNVNKNITYENFIKFKYKGM